METNAIEIRGLTKRYKDFALEDLNLSLPAGCVLGLVGENGAGKSTTIRLIMDALERDSGTVISEFESLKIVSPITVCADIDLVLLQCSLFHLVEISFSGTVSRSRPR